MAATQVAAMSVETPILEAVSYLGGPSFGPCNQPRLSGTAQHIAFSCQSGDIVTGDFNGRYDTFIKDRDSGQVVRVSVDSAGQEYLADSGLGIPSPDGMSAVFISAARLHPDVPVPPLGPSVLGLPHVFLRELRSSRTQLLGRDDTGAPAELGPTQLNDAQFGQSLVLFGAMWGMVSSIPYPPSRPYQLYVRNWQNDTVDLVSATPGGDYSEDNATAGASLSHDGRYVAFLSIANDLGPANPTGQYQLFLRDRALRTTRRISMPAAGGEFSGAYQSSRVGPFTYDERSLVVTVNSDELSTGDAPGLPDAYVIDLASRRYELISKGYGGAIPNGATFNADISGDGRYVAFFSRATNLMSTPQSAAAVYVKDRVTGDITNISASLGEPFPSAVSDVDISDDGSTVAFSWRHATSVPIVSGRTLIYTTRLRGTPLAQPVIVPATGALSLLMLLLSIVLVARRSIRHKTICFSTQLQHRACG